MKWIDEYEKFSAGGWSPTKLSEPEEKKFQQWLRTTQLFKGFKTEIAMENNLPVAAIDDSRITQMILESEDYDYRGAWKSGIKEEVSPHDGKVHWPSSGPDGKMLKSPGHPTTWKEFFMREHQKDPDDLGLKTLDDAKRWEMDGGKRMADRPLMRGK